MKKKNKTSICLMKIISFLEKDLCVSTTNNNQHDLLREYFVNFIEIINKIKATLRPSNTFHSRTRSSRVLKESNTILFIQMKHYY